VVTGGFTKEEGKKSISRNRKTW